MKTLAPSEIQAIANTANLDISNYNIEEISIGIPIEMEHGTELGSDTNITNDNLALTLKIVIAHLKEVPDYYTKFVASGIEEMSTPANVPGMGSIIFPTSNTAGSGDIPFGDYDEYNNAKKSSIEESFYIKSFEQFIDKD